MDKQKKMWRLLQASILMSLSCGLVVSGVDPELDTGLLGQCAHLLFIPALLVGVFSLWQIWKIRNEPASKDE